MSDIIFNDQNEVIEVKNKNKVDFKTLAKNNRLSEKFILENADFLDWSIISENQTLTIEIMVNCAKKIKWVKLPLNPNIPADAVLLAKYKGDLGKMIDKEAITEDFLATYQDLINWQFVSTMGLSNNFLDKMADKVNWLNFFWRDRKDELFLRKNLFRIDAFEPQKKINIWLDISKSQTVSEQFLRDFESKIHFNMVALAKNHTLSDAFVEDFKYILNQKLVLKTQSKSLSKMYLADYKKFDKETFYQDMTEEWLENYIDLYPCRISWVILSKKVLSERFMAKYWEKFDLNLLRVKNTFTENLIREVAPKMTTEYDWKNVFEYQAFSQAFVQELIDKYPQTFDFKNICYSLTINNLSENFIREYQDKWNFKGIGQMKQLSEPFLREFADKWDWEWNIAYCQQVSESFLQEFQDKFTEEAWRRISERQVLSEDFIKEFQKKLSWNIIAEHQILSEKFLRELNNDVFGKIFWDNAFWNNIAIYQDYSEDFRKEFADKLKINTNDESLMIILNQKAFQILLYNKINPIQLEKALRMIEKALFYKSKTTNSGTPNYVDNIKVRLLLLLNEENEAFFVVKRALEKDNNFAEFQDFKTNESYLEWLKNNQ